MDPRFRPNTYLPAVPNSGQGSRSGSHQTQGSAASQAYTSSANPQRLHPSLNLVQIQPIPHQETPMQQTNYTNVTNAAPASAPGPRYGQLPNLSQGMPVRQVYSDNIPPTANDPISGSRQTQPHQVAPAIPFQYSQQRTTFNAAHPTSIFKDGIEHVYIAVMGITGSGKSTFVGICSKQDAPIGRRLHSSQSTHLPHSKLDH